MKKLNKIIAKIIIFFIKIYQYTLSPDKGIPSFWLKGKICVHNPHCSKYGIQVLERYGFYPGFFMLMERVSNCHPWNSNTYDPAYLQTVFFSSAPIGVPFLEELIKDKRYNIQAVVTQPDKPAGRGQKIKENIIKQEAKKLGINKIFTPEKINPNKSIEGKEFFKEIERLKPDVILVIAYGKIIPIDLLNLPSKGALNIHGSLLPKYRGASPIQSVFLNNETYTGITLMKMAPSMDTGDIIKQLSFEIGFNWTSKDIIDKFMQVGPKFTTENIRKYAKKELIEHPQDKSTATYCHKIEKKDGKIDIFTTPLEDIFNKYKAFFLWPKIWFEISNNLNKKIIIEEMKIDEEKFDLHKKKPLIDKDFYLNQSIDLLRVKPEGKKAITWNEFKKGYL
ncbi:methionyl-tRNA formyltransferase [Candidatus Absconditicoccus praedator]|uniref:methionyl-tRNA formyltransferase n=1 Tax=Candidatus Absconditicoccus praedator TaxID=2735562 RepID=UPI001E297546|nr:methionyl-tRNA formyltransferase [Candidatus Absconditicoccus praedator]UFX82991.1 methionyl-tRNA formyltransferase [Candidatus Absconditicoccus praedator]